MTAPVDTIDPMALTAAALAALFDGSLEGPTRLEPLGEIVSDSRRVQEGGVFVALPGEHDDGHGHVRDATEAGAALAVVDRSFVAPVRRPDVLLRVDGTATALREACTRRLDELGCAVVGITGSVGKTTVKEMCAHVLAGSRRVAKTPGNMNTWTGVPLAVLNLEPPVDVFVAELAMSAPGEIRDLAGFTRPDVGVVLNVGLAHVGLLGTIDNIAAAKAELLEAMPPHGVAVLNADDPYVVAMGVAATTGSTASGNARLRTAASGVPLPRLPSSLGRRRALPDAVDSDGGAASLRVVWFGADAAFRAREIVLDGFSGSSFVLCGPEGEARVRLRVPGGHAVVNACAAAAVAAQFGVGVGEVAERLLSFEVPAQRGRVVKGKPGVLIYDDCYNSSPTSLAAALDVLAKSGAARRVAVVGDMLELGDHAGAEHHAAGRRAAAAATALIAVGAHAELVRDGAIEAGMTADSVAAVPDADQAAVLALDVAAFGPCSRGAPPATPGRPAPQVAVLVKGSRGLGLERVVEALSS